MKYPVILPRIWLLMAVFQGTGADRKRPADDLKSFAYSRADLDDDRRRALEDAKQRLEDVVPPAMFKLYADQETRGARLPFSVVRSFYDQGHHHHYQWRTEEGVRGLEPLPLAYGLRNKSVTMRQNMVFSTKKYEQFSGDSPSPDASTPLGACRTSTPPILKS